MSDSSRALARSPGALQGYLLAWLLIVVPMCALAAEAGDPRPALAQSLSASRSFNIPAGELAPALNRFAEQSGLMLIYPAELAAGRTTHGLAGSYVPIDGLGELLRGTGVDARVTGEKSVALEPLPTAAIADGVTTMRSVRVTADAIGEESGVFEQPRSVNRITREDIVQMGARHASEILQELPGVAAVTNEQIPSVSVNLRGLKDFGRVNMNIDGMRQNYQRTGHQQRNGEMFFDPELLSSVEVVKGPSSGVGGAGVVGGIASFRTLAVDDVLDGGSWFGAQLRASSGVPGWDNGQELSGHVVLAARSAAGMDALLAYSRKNSDEYEPGRRGTAYVTTAGFALPASVVSGTAMDVDSLLAKAGWQFTPAQRLQFTLLGLDATYRESSQQNSSQGYSAWFCAQSYIAEDPAYDDYCAEYGTYDPANVYPVSGVNRTRNRNFALDYRFHPEGRLIDFAAKAYFVDTRNVYTSLSQGIDNRTQTETVGGQLGNTASLALGGDWNLEWRLGGEAFRDRTRPEDGSTTTSGNPVEEVGGLTPEGRRSIVSGFTSGTLYWSDFAEFNAGLRYDRYALRGTTGYRNLLIRVDHGDSRLLPTVGVAIRPWQSVQLFANAGRGWRPPAITETLISGAPPGHGFGANNYPNYTLQPETTDSWEVGVNFTRTALFGGHDGLAVKLVHFDTVTEHYMFLASGIGLPGDQNPGLGSAMFANSLDDVRFRGEELTVDYDAGIAYARLNATRIERIGHLVTHYWPSGGGPDDEHWRVTLLEDMNLYNPLPPKYTATLNLGVRPWRRDVDLGVQVRHTSRSGDHAAYAGDFEQWNYVNSSSVVDLYGRWHIRPGLTLGFNLRNVADREYMQAQADAFVRTYAPGRTLTAWLEWKP